MMLDCPPWGSGPLRDPEGHQTRLHRRELRRVRFRAHTRASCAIRRARHGGAPRTRTRKHHPSTSTACRSPRR